MLLAKGGFYLEKEPMTFKNHALSVVLSCTVLILSCQRSESSQVLSETQTSATVRFQFADQSPGAQLEIARFTGSQVTDSCQSFRQEAVDWPATADPKGVPGLRVKIPPHHALEIYAFDRDIPCENTLPWGQGTHLYLEASEKWQELPAGLANGSYFRFRIHPLPYPMPKGSFIQSCENIRYGPYDPNWQAHDILASCINRQNHLTPTRIGAGRWGFCQKLQNDNGHLTCAGTDQACYEACMEERVWEWQEIDRIECAQMCGQFPPRP